MTLDPNNSNDVVVLADLINGEVMGLIVGDKAFTDFFYSTLPGDDMPDPEQVNVFGFQDEDGNFGVSFQGAFIDLPGNGPSDALIRFTVSVTDEGLDRLLRIHDAHLFAGGVGLGSNSVFTIDETFQQEPTKSLNVFSTTLGQAPNQKLSDWVDFDQLHTSLRVTKDIFALADDDADQPVRATVIDQSFSQVEIPEPATFGLAGLALLAMAASRRRQ